ncbi:glycoside hydrolase family 15 [Ornithinimicrobium flavum]|uniref:glycoside hydrolase family 15 n=1 Tax=Ornithinimicrobium flavum TaxID=1288636 RepID=UPI00106F1344|nr:glycoside hydrolase family 15 [Ornithinimicrobium flavum]
MTAASIVLGLAVTSVAGWSADPAPVDPHTRVGLRGELVHYPYWDVPGAEDKAWIEAGTLPGAGTSYEEMSRTALWDLKNLSENLATDAGFPPAGPAENWGYFWPRDGAFLAVALARTGHADLSVELMTRTSELYLDPMYGFDARYLLSGGRIYLDPRRAQVDGCGWVLWAIHETTQVASVPSVVDDLRDRCTDQLLRATGGGSHLPAPGQDYWEQTTYDHLLGASAPVAAGLRFAAADYRTLGDDQRADQVQQAAAGVRSEIGEFFGPDYLRAGTHGGLDAATAMLMPPFDPDPLPGVHEAWLGYQQEAARAGGGLAPGSQWKNDGISWTPEVALVAYAAAASGQDELAHHWLDWLDQHRAPWGSLPEKVDSQGRPGGPAPLGWTSALVILTLDALA